MTDPRPAWRRETPGERRWPSAVAIAVAIGLQLLLPDSLVLQPKWLLPAVEGALLLALWLANPRRMTNPHPLVRPAALTLVGAMSLANVISAGLLVIQLLSGNSSDDPRRLIGSGAAIYATNILAFAVWYWELDREGPVARAQGKHQHTDFLFPQMTLQDPTITRPDWEPTFVDYLYLSFTNATAFSPTDTLPLSRWAKLLMLVQSAVALSAVALVIARAVNVLK